MNEKEIRIVAEEEAIKNKAKYGEASSKVVFGMVMKNLKGKISKQDIVKVREIVENIVEEVNKRKDVVMKEKDKEQKANKEKLYDINYLIENLKPLPNAKHGEVVTRMEPSPSGPLHLGHIFTLLINYWYAKKYNGKFILRIADTNAKNILPESYNMIAEDAEWLIGELPEIVTQSERMELYYEVAKYLIEDGRAYVCTCKPEKFKKYVDAKKPCPHRDQSISKNLEMWERMLKCRYDEGEAVLRIKTNLEHENPAVRDWPAFRIIKEKHPLTHHKYCVWPLMNFSVAVDDHHNNITHVIRGKDHLVNTERQKYIYEYMQWDLPEFLHMGKINFTDLKLSTTQIKKDIKEHKYEGWDDVRLPFVRSFKKRGFHPKAFSIWVLQIGFTTRDKKTSYEEFMKNLIKINRVLIDKESRRLFFVKDPVKIKIINLKEDVEIKLPYHPDVSEYGERMLNLKASDPYVFLEKNDWERLDKEKSMRLKGLGVLRKKSDNEGELDLHDTASKLPVVHYLPSGNEIKAKVVMPDASIIDGLAEYNLKEFFKESRFQFERFGFVKLDKIYIDPLLYYIHK
ncbi:MAG: glutamate--tRNA ligase [Candidatus Nanohaloarchaeota archaeon]|nr:glutamate--tRNA ligase [Candidatus Nanohaloarchaeota archaeon]